MGRRLPLILGSRQASLDVAAVAGGAALLSLPEVQRVAEEREQFDEHQVMNREQQQHDQLRLQQQHQEQQRCQQLQIAQAQRLTYSQAMQQPQHVHHQQQQLQQEQQLLYFGPDPSACKSPVEFGVSSPSRAAAASLLPALQAVRGTAPMYATTVPVIACITASSPYFEAMPYHPHYYVGGYRVSPTPFQAHMMAGYPAPGTLLVGFDGASDTQRSLYNFAGSGQSRSDTNFITRPTLLKELRNSYRWFELSDIAGHVVEFSADPHGSQFIWQKLRIASPEEKSMVFQEVLPRVLRLMYNVFATYVIEKLFDCGTPHQRRDLASQLIGHVLALSLHRYGSRVIEKALEVVDVDQQTQLVSELDGHVKQCATNKSGSFVIRKCLAFVPPERIHFMLSTLYGQVLVLSMHRYGSRVIQTVLERFNDDQNRSDVMKIILSSACSLAQDQYGNFVVQHVLEHGRSHERSDIIGKLASQIVQLSQHKFASHVVEKCLTFGGPAERQSLICDILGPTDKNEPLQAMMKNQFGNYVIQKLVETCDDAQREMLLSRMRVHLHALKESACGLYFVARIEKLVAAGARQSAATAAYNLDRVADGSA